MSGNQDSISRGKDIVSPPIPISAQFMDNDSVAMFELAIENEQIVVVDEKHYRLVAADLIERGQVINYR
jgi:hypothetical protein